MKKIIYKQWLEPNDALRVTRPFQLDEYTAIRLPDIGNRANKNRDVTCLTDETEEHIIVEIRISK